MLRSRATHERLVLLIIGLGLACRIAQYAFNTSLWHDEAFVALNVVNKSFAGFFGPLDWHEPSPPLFLVAEKLIINALGASEYALRLLPLVAGLLGVIAYAALVKRMTSGAVQLWAMVMLAVSDKLVAQSNEVKHFTLDTLIAVLLTWLALSWLTRPRVRVLLGWAVLGAVGLWLSYASAFVFAGTSFTIAVLAGRRATTGQRIGFVAANALVAASFLALLGPIHAQTDDGVLGFWQSAFPPLMQPAALTWWVAKHTLGFFDYFWQPLGALVGVMATLGARAFWRSGRRAELMLLASPTVASLIAAGMQRWPFGGNQHMVFAAPAVLFLTAEGLEVCRAHLVRWRPAAATVATTAFLLPAVGVAVYHFAVPRQRHEARPAIQFVTQHRDTDQQLIVGCPAEWAFYTGATATSDALPLDATRPVWFVGTRSGRKPFPQQDLLDHLTQTRPLLRSIEPYGAGAYLFGAEWRTPR